MILNDFNTTVKKALSEIDEDFMDYKGLIVCGTHSPHDVDLMLHAIKEARETGIPFLGICFGHQLAAIEYARNVMGIKDATSEELGKGTWVVVKRPYLNVGLKDGESWWNHFEVIPEIEEKWMKPSNFITCQYHPEYQSSKEKPHPLLVKFIELCKKHGNVK